MEELRFVLGHGGPRPSGFRIILTDAAGASVEPSAALTSFVMHQRPTCSYGRDAVTFAVPPGTYHFVASAGPEWTMSYGSVAVADAAPPAVAVTLSRIARPREEGWMAVDDHVHPWPNPMPEMEAVCDIEGIDLCGIQFFGSYTDHQNNYPHPGSPAFQTGRVWATTDQEVEMHSPWGPWEDSSVIGLREKLPDVRTGIGYLMNRHFFDAARRQGCAMIVYQSPTWAQFPVDLALGLVDSVNLCDNYLSILRALDPPCEYTYFPADHLQQRQPFGISRWIYDHYYRALNAGFALPVSGGSAFPNGGGGGPVGLARFYAQTGTGPTTPEHLFTAWRQGRTFASNGPLLSATVDGAAPGTNRLASLGAASRLAIDLISNRPVHTLEWIADGEVVASRSLTGADRLRTRWEVEVDLRKHHWVTARCFGDSERSLFPAGGRTSSPFLTAHTSPICLPRFGTPGQTRQRARESYLSHLRWMEAVATGQEKTTFDDAHLFTGMPLSERELGYVLANLHEAARILTNPA